MKPWTVIAPVALTLLAAAILIAPSLSAEPASPEPGPSAELEVASEPAPALKLTFGDVREDTAKFMRLNETIQLTPAQEEVRRKALTAMKAPCCDNKSALTCCCPCNMAKSWWGVSKYMIAEHDAGVAEVKEAVQDWFDFINPKGFTGDACYTGGGCGRAFAQNGCGGMKPGQVIWP